MSTPPRAMGHADRVNDDDAVERGEHEPSTSELAEALFLTVQALKSTGRDCMEGADPALRAISMPRGRVLEAVAQAEAEAGPEGGATMPAGPQRGRHRFHETLRAHAERGRVRMGDLAAALGVTARNVTTIVDGLEREGLLTRRPHPTDRRAILLEMTEKGRAHIAQIHALHHTIAQRFFAPLDAAERAELLRLLAKLHDGEGSCEGVGDGGHTNTL